MTILFSGTIPATISQQLPGVISQMVVPLWPQILSTAVLVVLFIFLMVKNRRIKTLLAENRRLEEEDKFKNMLLANTTHELRTPLTGITGITESLLDGVTGPLRQQTRFNLNLILSSSRRLTTLINDILDYSKVRDQSFTLVRQPVDTYKLVKQTVDFFQQMVKGRNVELIAHFNPEMPWIDADEARIQQILYNLLGNAIKFTESGRIEIFAEPTAEADDEKPMLRISVRDTGIGIPKERLHSIFESYKQASAETTKRYGGTGLGLSICKQLIELHGGEISAESSLNQGSCFSFTIPISPRIPTPQQDSENMDRLITPGEKDLQLAAGKPYIQRRTGHQRITLTGTYNILLVDDEPVNLTVLENYLSDDMYHISKSLSGVEALELINNGDAFDLIILDIMMPRMSGYEVCEKIRDQYLPSELPIILLTAKDQVSDIVNGFNAGANDYLTKPFSKDVLLSRIKTHLQLAKINQAYGRFVPHEFLQFLEKESILDVKLGEQVEKDMTILFSDIRDFTSLSENISPKENFRFINSYLSKMEPNIINYHGFIDKYMGDSIMALFPTEADDAVAASIGMLNSLREYNDERKRAGYIPIQIGIGLNTGLLMLGTVGGQHRMDGTVISNAVNLASRVEGMTKLYNTSMLITHNTFLKLKNPENYSIRLIDRVKAKGKREPVTIYEIFDADVPSVREKKRATQVLFDEAYRLYCQKKFPQSKQSFLAVLDKNPEDRVAEVYINRCEYYKEHGVPKEWSGIESLSVK